jgi:hypothetical protein
MTDNIEDKIDIKTAKVKDCPCRKQCREGVRH